MAQNITAGGCTILALPSFRDRIPVIVDEVTTLVGPGELIDVVVTERGIAVNPRRTDLLEKVKGSGLPIRPIQDIQADVDKICGGKPRKARFVRRQRIGGPLQVCRHPRRKDLQSPPIAARFPEVDTIFDPGPRDVAYGSYPPVRGTGRRHDPTHGTESDGDGRFHDAAERFVLGKKYPDRQFIFVSLSLKTT